MGGGADKLIYLFLSLPSPQACSFEETVQATAQFLELLRMPTTYSFPDQLVLPSVLPQVCPFEYHLPTPQRFLLLFCLIIGRPLLKPNLCQSLSLHRFIFIYLFFLAHLPLAQFKRHMLIIYYAQNTVISTNSNYQSAVKLFS